jgi:hypothetical protein
VEVQELARRQTAASIAALVRIRDDASTPPAAVVAAATALLDRAWGLQLAIQTRGPLGTAARELVQQSNPTVIDGVARMPVTSMPNVRQLSVVASAR